MARQKKVKGICLPKYFRFGGKKYQLKWSRMKDKFGLCAAPHSAPEDRIIWINPSASKEDIINSIIHEAIHAELWCLDEEYVASIADSLTELLKVSGAISLE